MLCPTWSFPYYWLWAGERTEPQPLSSSLFALWETQTGRWILTILEFILDSSSIASSCFFFSGSSVSSFLYFLLLLRKGAKNEREKWLGDMFVGGVGAVWGWVYTLWLNDIRRRNCVHIMWGRVRIKTDGSFSLPGPAGLTSDASKRTLDGNKIGPIRFWSSANIHRAISGSFSGQKSLEQ